jgi:pimeloyl-ACP methyl ester carboxylesterase
MKTGQPPWINKELFSFTSHWIEIDEYQMHYIDEGSGPVILFVHGTPEWSFGYRDVINGLKSDYRCVAIDHIGFGLSDKPPGEVYGCKDHAARLKKFIEVKGLKNITIIANDFGGGIALSYAISYPKNIQSIVLFNTWMWSLKNDKHYSGHTKVINSWLGKFLYLKMNFPVNTIMPSAFGDRKKLTKEVHRHYKQALPDPSSRRGAYTFAKELMNASDWWQGNWEQLDKLSANKFLIFWGMKDKFVALSALDNWKKKIPTAKFITYDDAGHFVQEEKAEEMVLEIRKFLKAEV